jgi:hypothetical protein
MLALITGGPPDRDRDRPSLLKDTAERAEAGGSRRAQNAGEYGSAAARSLSKALKKGDDLGTPGAA